MICYRDDPGPLRANQLHGFFVGWPRSPSAEQLLAVLSGSHRCVYAYDGVRVVGFVHAISDGSLTAFVPWLEVLPEHQGRGIGVELLTRLLAGLQDLYSVDVVCDPALRGFYERFGMRPLLGMGLRNASALSAPPGGGHLPRNE